jgi:hypothetical protein
MIFSERFFSNTKFHQNLAILYRLYEAAHSQNYIHKALLQISVQEKERSQQFFVEIFKH